MYGTGELNSVKYGIDPNRGIFKSPEAFFLGCFFFVDRVTFRFSIILLSSIGKCDNVCAG